MPKKSLTPEPQDQSITENTELSVLLDAFFKKPLIEEISRQMSQEPRSIIKDIPNENVVPLDVMKKFELSPSDNYKPIPVQNEPLLDVHKVTLEQDDPLLSVFIEKLADKEMLSQFIAEIGEMKTIELLKDLSIERINRMSGRDSTIVSCLSNLGDMTKNMPIYYNSLHESTKDFIDQMQRFLVTHEIGNRLGLGNKYHEGFNTSHSTQATRDRFHQFVDKVKVSRPIHVNRVNDLQVTVESVNKQLSHHGDVESIICEWLGHGFSFHFVQDNGRTHFIYVNRGLRHELANDTDPAVSVYTINDKKDAEQLVNNLLAVLKTENREKISEFISHELQPHTNEEVSEILAKSNQKVGNCTVANANISWHFALASNLMKQQPELSFTDAYKETTAAYKVMRMEDRADAFCSLLKFKDFYHDDYHNNALIQVMEKMYHKDLKNPDRRAIAFLVHKLKEKNPEALEALYRLVVKESFISKDSIKSDIKWRWIAEIYQMLPAETQQKLVHEHLEVSLSSHPSVYFKSNLHDLTHEQQDPALIEAYQVLNLPATASDADIRSRYKELALKHHPDRNPGNEKFHAEQFKKIDAAYKLIRDFRDSNSPALDQETTGPHFRVR